MAYELSIVRLKRGYGKGLSFPLFLDAVERSPLGGPFDGVTRTRLAAAIGAFPFCTRVEGPGDVFEIEAPSGGLLEVWLTPDGNLFLQSQAGLELAWELLRYLCAENPDIALEDPRYGLLHDDASFARCIAAADYGVQHAA